MPIPIILAIAAIGTAVYGVVKGVDAKKNHDTAKAVAGKASDAYDRACKSLEREKDSARISLEVLGREKLAVAARVIGRAVSLIERVHGADVDALRSSRFDVRTGFPAVDEMGALSLRADEALGASVAALGSGALAGAGAVGIAGLIGTASTGTAIAGLSGAAATNATLAWLGGGALAAGGYGMAGGMAVLGGLFAGPFLAVIGIFAAAKTWRNLEKAHEYEKNVAIFCEQVQSARLKLTAVSARAFELKQVIGRMAKLVEAHCVQVEEDFADLQAPIEYASMPGGPKTRYQQLLVLTTALYDLLNVDIINEVGDLDESSGVTVKEIVDLYLIEDCHAH